jgi:hypothetical protein
MVSSGMKNAEVIRDGSRLRAKGPGRSGNGEDMAPESETSFSFPRFITWISFVRDSSGKVTGIFAYQDAYVEAKKLD